MRNGPRVWVESQNGWFLDMSRPTLVAPLAALLNSAVGAACGCGARAWSIVVERNLVGLTARAEIRSR